jgi:hypothetical protein
MYLPLDEEEEEEDIKKGGDLTQSLHFLGQRGNHGRIWV